MPSHLAGVSASPRRVVLPFSWSVCLFGGSCSFEGGAKGKLTASFYSHHCFGSGLESQPCAFWPPFQGKNNHTREMWASSGNRGPPEMRFFFWGGFP